MNIKIVRIIKITKADASQNLCKLLNIACSCRIFFIFFLAFHHGEDISVDRFSESPVATSASVLSHCLGSTIRVFR